jgi:hypothetical protein
VLPFVAVLQGLEVFHASAVVTGEHAVAIVGGSGAGKTSLGLALALRGLPFLTDDVLAVERDAAGGVVAYPGPGIANVAKRGGGLAERIQQAGLGRSLGATRDEIRMSVRRREARAMLTALFYVERTWSGTRVEITPLPSVDPRLIIASTFNVVLRQPERLARQLDICGRIAESCTIFKVRRPPGIDATMLAAAIHDEVEALEGLPA